MESMMGSSSLQFCEEQRLVSKNICNRLDTDPVRQSSNLGIVSCDYASNSGPCKVNRLDILYREGWHAHSLAHVAFCSRLPFRVHLCPASVRQSRTMSLDWCGTEGVCLFSTSSSVQFGHLLTSHVFVTHSLLCATWTIINQ